MLMLIVSIPEYRPHKPPDSVRLAPQHVHDDHNQHKEYDGLRGVQHPTVCECT